MARLVAVLVGGGMAFAAWSIWTRQAQSDQAAQIVPAYAPAEPKRDYSPLIEWGLGEAVNLFQSMPENRTGESKLSLGNIDLGKLLGGIQGGDQASDQGGDLGGMLKGVLLSGSSVGSRLMRDLQRDFGLTRYQAAGVVGNLDHESAGFASLQEINPLVDGSRGGYGYAQWTGPRRRAFEAWAAQRGLSLASYEANYGFLKHELTNTSERAVLPPLRRARDVVEATIIFQNKFLRPGIPHTASRIERARRYV